MGGICGKPSAIEDSQGSPRRERQSNKVSSELRVSRLASSKREESFRVKDRGDVRIGSIDKKSNSSRRVRDDHFEKKRENSEVIANYVAIGSLPKATEGEQVVAGWPSWLAASAGEAFEGWLPRRADTFEKLDWARNL